MKLRERPDRFAKTLANLRSAYRWAAGQSDLDVASTIATWAAWLGFWTENYEPIAWTEELIEPARTADHPAPAFLYAMASSCWWPGRIEAAVGYSDAGRAVIDSGHHDKLPFGLDGALGAAYLHCGQPERQVEWCRARLEYGRDTHGISRAFLAVALTVAGRGEEARAAANGLIDISEATGNPAAISFALYAYGYAFGDADPAAALDAQRRGL